MKIKIILLPIILLLFSNLYSQSNIKSGYMIDIMGDTVKGFIDFRDWEVNPKTILFGLKDTLVKTQVNPRNIKEFGVEGLVYRSAIVQINTSPYKTENLNFSPMINLVTDTVFLQALILGKKNLYSYYDKFGRDNFYIDGEKSPELLIYQRYLKKVNNLNATNIILTNNKYLGQLMVYFEDCPDVKPLIEKTEYSHFSLINLFTIYYKNTGKSISYKEAQYKNKDEFGLLAGMSLTHIFFAGGAVPYLSKTAFRTSAMITAGVYYNLVLNKNLAKWSINNEIQYFNYSTDGVYNEFKSANQYSTTYCQFNLSYLKLNNMLRYILPYRDIHYFAEAGISNGLIINIKNYKKETSVFYSSTTIKEGKALYDPRPNEQSWLLGFGAKYKRYTLSYRYEKGNGISNFSWLKSDVIRHYILMTYNFK